MTNRARAAGPLPTERPPTSPTPPTPPTSMRPTRLAAVVVLLLLFAPAASAYLPNSRRRFRSTTTTTTYDISPLGGSSPPVGWASRRRRRREFFAPPLVDRPRRGRLAPDPALTALILPDRDGDGDEGGGDAVNDLLLRSGGSSSSSSPMLRSMTRTLLLANEEMAESGGGSFSDKQLAIIVDFLETFYIPKLTFSRDRKVALMWSHRLLEGSKVIMGAATVLISGLLQRGSGVGGGGGGVIDTAAAASPDNADLLGEYGLLSITVLGGVQTLVVSFGTLFQPRERAMMHLVAASELESAWDSFVWGARAPRNVLLGDSSGGGGGGAAAKYDFWGSAAAGEAGGRTPPWAAFRAFASACIVAASLSRKAQMEALDENEEG